jgi:hypothetical protein
MNEPAAELSAKINRAPMSKMIRMTGNNQNFRRSIKKAHKSFKNSIALLLV